MKKILVMLMLGAFLAVTAASTIGCDDAKPTSKPAMTPTKP